MTPEHKISHWVFGTLSKIILRYPWWIVVSFSLLAGASSWLSWTKLEMKTDQNDLVSSDLPYNQRYLKFLDEFGDLEYLYVVVVVNKDFDRAVKIVEEIGAEVGKLTEHVDRVFYRVAPEAFGRSLLLLAPSQRLTSISNAIASSSEAIQGLKKVDSFESWIRFLAGMMRPSLGDVSREDAERVQGLVTTSLDALAASARGEDPRGLEAAFHLTTGGASENPRERGYLFVENGELAFVEIMPKKDFHSLEVIREPLERIRSVLDQVRAHYPGTRIGLTGRTVLQADEMRTTNDDMTYSTILAFVLVIGLFVLFFKRLRRPLLAGAALCIAIGITFGVVTATIGHLTLLSIVFAVMLVGLGVDFGVVLIARYQEELMERGSVDESIRATLLSTGMGVWTGALTTGCAFFSSIFVNFKGLAELGLVTAMGLLVCLICMIVLLPALVVISDRYIQKKRTLHPPRPVTIPCLAYAAARPRITLCLFAGLTFLGFLTFRGLPYNSNLLDLQAKGLESVELESIILEKSERSTWFSAFVLDGLPGVDRTVAALRAAQQAGIVDLVESVRDYVPLDQVEKMKLLEPARAAIGKLKLPPPATTVDVSALASSLDLLLDRLSDLQSLAAQRGEKGIADVKGIEELIERVEQARKLVAEGGAKASESMAKAQPRWIGELGTLATRLVGYLEPPPITIGDLPEVLRNRFISKDGTKHLVYAYPRKDIWQEEAIEEFVGAMRAVDPDVTGVPVQVFESARLMHSGFIRAALYSLIMVFCILLVDFRSLKYTLLTMVPVLTGTLWALELMPLFGLEFNLANFFALPIIIGCGVDAGVHMVHRFRETNSTADVGRTTGAAVTLANLSNVLGFASMAIAKHRGLASLGIVAALGCLTVLVASVILLPCLLELLKKRLLPSTGENRTRVSQSHP